jgi:hypothetical protein
VAHRPSAAKFQNVKSHVGVNDDDQPTLIDHHIIDLRCRAAADMIGDEVDDLVRSGWLRYIDDPQAGAELDRMHERPCHALGEVIVRHVERRFSSGSS